MNYPWEKIIPDWRFSFNVLCRLGEDQCGAQRIYCEEHWQDKEGGTEFEGLGPSMAPEEGSGHDRVFSCAERQLYMV